MSSGRTQLENHLQAFMRKFGLRAEWHTPLLLRLEPQPGSRNATAVVDLVPGFWEAFDAMGERARTRALDELLGKVTGPYVPDRQGEALVAIGSLGLLREVQLRAK